MQGTLLLYPVVEVSVPLRGKGRDQRAQKGQLVLDGVVDGFPSPCGEKVGINPAKEAPAPASKPATFPSPCGEKVGINDEFCPICP